MFFKMFQRASISQMINVTNMISFPQQKLTDVDLPPDREMKIRPVPETMNSGSFI